MIPRGRAAERRKRTPRVRDSRVGREVTVGRAPVGTFSHPATDEGLAFRGGTALHASSVRHRPPAVPGTSVRCRSRPDPPARQRTSRTVPPARRASTETDGRPRGIRPSPRVGGCATAASEGRDRFPRTLLRTRVSEGRLFRSFAPVRRSRRHHDPRAGRASRRRAGRAPSARQGPGRPRDRGVHRPHGAAERSCDPCLVRKEPRGQAARPGIQRRRPSAPRLPGGSRCGRNEEAYAQPSPGTSRSSPSIRNTPRAAPPAPERNP